MFVRHLLFKNLLRNPKLLPLHNNKFSFSPLHKTFLYFSTSNTPQLSSNNTTAITHYNNALNSYLSLSGDAFNSLEKALKLDPQFAMAWILTGFLKIASTGVRFLNEDLSISEAKNTEQEQLLQAINNASKCPLNTREQLHLNALKFQSKGRLKEAVYNYELALINSPTDILASRCAHDTYFFLGDSEEMRNSVCRVLPSHSNTESSKYRLYGMYAFALEECNEYRLAEDCARKCIDYDASDIQGCHALTHCYEMQGRYREGIQFLNATEESQKKRDQLSIHNYQHQALFLINLGMYEEALTMYDTEIFNPSKVQKVLDIIDAISILWRCDMLSDISVGKRWENLLKVTLKYVKIQTSSFNDIHQMMCLCGAKQEEGALQHLKRMENVVVTNGKLRKDAYVQHTKIYGLEACKGLKAFSDKKYSECVKFLLPVVLRNLSSIGGSHAQRSVVRDTLCEAAKRSSNENLYSALKNQKMFKHWNFV